MPEASRPLQLGLCDKGGWLRSRSRDRCQRPGGLVREHSLDGSACADGGGWSGQRRGQAVCCVLWGGAAEGASRASFSLGAVAGVADYQPAAGAGDRTLVLLHDRGELVPEGVLVRGAGADDDMGAEGAGAGAGLGGAGAGGAVGVDGHPAEIRAAAGLHFFCQRGGQGLGGAVRHAVVGVAVDRGGQPRGGCGGAVRGAAGLAGAGCIAGVARAHGADLSGGSADDVLMGTR